MRQQDASNGPIKGQRISAWIERETGALAYLAIR